MQQSLDEAEKVLRDSIIYYRGEPVGTAAACAPEGLSAENYRECFVRDFVISALVFMVRGEYAIVRNFLKSILDIQCHRRAMSGHKLASGMMPASFLVEKDESGKEF